jgi:transposase InsO family protein
MTNWPPVRRPACSPSWTRSAGSRPSSIRGSAIEPKTLSRPWNRSATQWAIRRRSGSTKVSSFVSRDLDLWAYTRDVTLDFSRPGKPTDNAFIEAFNGRLRAECLNAHWFLTLADAREKLEDWRKDYNEVRPHRAIRQQAPGSLMTPAGASSPPT